MFGGAEVHDGGEREFAGGGVAESEVRQAAEGGGEARRAGHVLEEEVVACLVAVGGGEVDKRVELVELEFLGRGEVVVGSLAAQVPKQELVVDGVGTRGDGGDLGAAGTDAVAVELVGVVEVRLVRHKVGGDDLEGHAVETTLTPMFHVKR